MNRFILALLILFGPTVVPQSCNRPAEAAEPVTLTIVIGQPIGWHLERCGYLVDEVIRGTLAWYEEQIPGSHWDYSVSWEEFAGEDVWAEGLRLKVTHPSIVVFISATTGGGYAGANPCGLVVFGNWYLEQIFGGGVTGYGRGALAHELGHAVAGLPDRDSGDNNIMSAVGVDRWPDTRLEISDRAALAAALR
jgi:hypothetical protein